MARTKLAALLLIVAQAAIPQMVNTGARRRVTGVACTVPTMTSRWAAYNSSNTCGGVACTNGAFIDGYADFVGSNPTGSNHAATHNATYNTAQINGLPAVTYSSGLGQYESFTTAITPTAGQTITYYVISKNPDPGVWAFFGSTTNQTPVWDATNTPNLEWQIHNVGYNQTGTHTLGAGFNTILMQFLYTSATAGQLSFWVCSGGSCSADLASQPVAISISASYSLLSPWNVFGRTFNNYSDFTVAEFGYYVGSANTTQIAAWSQCKYGI
jgi:hypothetical protein